MAGWRRATGFVASGESHNWAILCLLGPAHHHCLQWPRFSHKSPASAVSVANGEAGWRGCWSLLHNGNQCTHASYSGVTCQGPLCSSEHHQLALFSAQDTKVASISPWEKKIRSALGMLWQVVPFQKVFLKQLLRLVILKRATLVSNDGNVWSKIKCLNFLPASMVCAFYKLNKLPIHIVD